MSKNNKEVFRYEYSRPSSDWVDYESVEIKPDDYYYFKLERRFGPSWWLIGINPVEKPNYHWEEKQIGEIYGHDLFRFIQWAKSDRGSRIIEIKAISGEFNILDELSELLQKVRQFEKENNS